jgi:hypothetical protein
MSLGPKPFFVGLALIIHPHTQPSVKSSADGSIKKTVLCTKTQPGKNPTVATCKVPHLFCSNVFVVMEVLIAFTKEIGIPPGLPDGT